MGTNGSMRPRPSYLLALLLIVSTPALALDQPTHRTITVEACRSAGFDSVFCARVGDGDQNVDGREWDDMAAHAQASSADAMCDGAQATVRRLRAIGAELGPLSEKMSDTTADGVRVPAIEAFADKLGRGLHTFQDLCAHQGMTNIQHAWFSASDQCRGTKLSPDVQAEAIACAKQVTADVFAAVKEELAKRDAHPEQFPETSAYQGRLLPNLKQLCVYLQSAKQWDGKDHRWKLEVMKPALVNALFAGWRGEEAPEIDCADLEAEPAPEVATTGSAIVCESTEAVCEAADEADEVGCSASSTAQGAGWPFVALAFTAGVLFRRRTNRR